MLARSDAGSAIDVTADRLPTEESGAATIERAIMCGSRWSGVVTLATLVACGIGFFVLVQMVGPERLRDAVAATGPLAPTVYVLLKAATIVVTPVSGTPLRLAAGALFGFWQGVLLSVLGSALGGSLNFWIARRFGRGVVARILGPSALARVEPLLDRLADWRALALTRVVLAPLWDVLSYGLGLSRLRFRTYLLVAILGDVIPTMILVGVGSSVAEVGVVETGTNGAQAVQDALPALLALVVAGAAALALVVAALVLRPRLARWLARPGIGRSTARPTVVRSSPRPDDEDREPKISRMAS
jgi:uncharacterized membrane protein YdjX (TVP38/TMEM64 family)